MESQNLPLLYATLFSEDDNSNEREIKLEHRRFLENAGVSAHSNGPLAIAVRTEGVVRLRYPPPCEKCEDCRKQYRPALDQDQPEFSYLETLTDSEAQAVVQRHVKSIQENLEFLHSAVKDHGNRIVSRWKGQGAPGRETFLRKAKPEMFTELWAVNQSEIRMEGVLTDRPKRKAWLNPYLNIELLRAEPLRLLSLLYHRTNVDLEDWVLFDMLQTQRGYCSGALGLNFNASCVVMFGSDYGKLVPWNAKDAHACNVIGFPRAQLVLESQDELYQFLRIVVEELIVGVNHESGCSKMLVLANRDFRTGDELEIWSTFAYRDFRVPPGFNIESMVRTAETRKIEAMDHLWLLQTDPRYAKYTIDAANQNQAIKNLGGSLAKELAAVFALVCSIARAKAWCYILEECENVRRALHRYGGAIKIGQRLPEAFERARRALEETLIYVLRLQSLLTIQAMARSGAFDHIYEFGKVQSGMPTLSFTQNFKNSKFQKELFDKDPLAYLLPQILSSHIFNDEDCDVGHCYEILSHRMKNFVRKDVERIDQRLYDVIADLEACYELLYVLRYTRPLTTGHSLSPLDKTKLTEVDRMSYRRRRNESCIGGEASLKPVVEDIAAFIKAPWPQGKMGLDFLKQAQASRLRLKYMWKKIYENEKAAVKNQKLPADEMEFCLSFYKFFDSPDHEKFLNTKQQEIEAEEKKTTRPAMSTAPTQTYWEGAEPDFVNVLRPTSKLKTRPAYVTNKEASSASLKEEPVALPSKDSSNACFPFYVKPASFKVFLQMFPNPGEKFSKPVQWINFVKAMDDIGFIAHGGGGSSVSFQSADQKDRIVFHRPHPGNEIDIQNLRSWALRLNKWFGWTRETFKKKERSQD